ncbi:hypothetical protein KSP39_PZI023233 [Platanthera zijinensis]|uniref:Uncharacterized protein n=1 Tax=Platanthera zijinensis TaxID=2320716 RepID=A0AAP0FUN7_9ASPA
MNQKGPRLQSSPERVEWNEWRRGRQAQGKGGAMWLYHSGGLLNTRCSERTSGFRGSDIEGIRVDYS